MIKTAYKNWDIEIRRKTHKAWSGRRTVNFYASFYSPEGYGWDLTEPFTDEQEAIKAAQKAIGDEMFKEITEQEFQSEFYGR